MKVVASKLAVFVIAFILSNTVFISIMMYESFIFTGGINLDVEVIKSSSFIASVISLFMVGIDEIVNLSRCNS